MMWLTWRQFRVQAIVTAATVAALAVAFALTGPHLAHLYNTSGLPTCGGHGGCGIAANDFFHQLLGTADKALFFTAVAVLYVAPPLIGMFWGAPMVAKEMESGSLRLAWTQSVTRGRWLAVKLAFIGVIALATAGALSLILGWWASPIYRAGQYAPDVAFGVNKFPPLLFGVNGIVPIGYAAFAFLLGVTAGTLIRRTIPAMAVVLAGFTFVEFAWASWIRPHLITPVRAISPSNFGALNDLMIDPSTRRMIVVTAASKPGGWILSNQTIDSAGHLFTGPAPHVCDNGSPQACVAALAKFHLRQLVTYQPASRFWAFQWYETGIFLALALVLSLFCVWWLGRRRLA